jgi:beta-xylosidase
VNKRCILSAGLALGAFAGLAFSQLSSVPRNLPGTPGPSKEQSPRGRVAWRSGVLSLGDPQFQNDYPEVAVDRAGRVWAVWTAWSALREEIQVRRFAEGTWYSRFDVPGVTGNVWHPQVAQDAEGGMWFVWAQDSGYSARQSSEPNWDLYAARLVENEWGKPIRLTDHPLPDINHHLIADRRGRLWLAWQGFRGGQSDI